MEKESKTNDKEELRLRIVQAYIEALNKMSVEPIINAIHPHFYFRWADNQGIWTELRYIGHLCKAFAEMKAMGKRINAELVWLHSASYRFPAIKIHAPINTRIIFPFDSTYMDVPYPDHYEDVFMYPRIKHGKLFRVYCYASQENFDRDLWWVERKESPRGY
ncbi:MAG: hypothetical protein KA802_12485 [Saprospiraceae bacterium]|nr:hypothetical protein [Saprospiraceae bacterium]